MNDIELGRRHDVLEQLNQISSLEREALTALAHGNIHRVQECLNNLQYHLTAAKACVERLSNEGP